MTSENERERHAVHLRLTDDDDFSMYAMEFDVTLLSKELGRLVSAKEKSAEALLEALYTLAESHPEMHDVAEAAEKCGVPVLEVTANAYAAMPDELFRKWFDVLWDRFWDRTGGDETVGDMWKALESEGFPKEAFREECVRRGIIQQEVSDGQKA